LLKIIQLVKILSIVCALQVSLLQAEFWSLKTLGQLDSKDKRAFIESFEAQPRGEVLFQKQMQKFDAKRFQSVYAELGNLSLYWKLTGSEACLLELRERVNALCSFERWGNPKLEHSDLQMALSSLFLSLAYQCAGMDLPAIELSNLKIKLNWALTHYWQEFEQAVANSWAGSLNHPEHTMHLVAMVALSQCAADFNADLAAEVQHKLKRHFEKYFRMMGEAVDGSWPQGASLGSLSDLGIMLYLQYLIANEVSKDIEQSTWLRQRGDFYKMSFLPGQRQLLVTALGSELPLVRLAPILWSWSHWHQDRELQFLAESCHQEIDAKWDMWSFMVLLTRHSDITPYWNDLMSVEYFEESGVWSARSGRRAQSSQLSFICGNPFGASIYSKAVSGYPEVSLDWATPSQGSYSWVCEGQSIFEHAGEVARNKTEHYNTLSIDQQGQLFEPYPKVRRDMWVKSPVAGRLQQQLRFGDSLLVQGEFANCYPKSLQLEKFNRTLIWLGETILIVVDQIKTSREAELMVWHRSQNKSFVESEMGFRHSGSGLEMKTWSEPKGLWTVGQDTLPSTATPHYFAKHGVKTDQWLRVSIMAPTAWLLDFHTEHPVGKHIVDFSEGNYRVEYRPEAQSGESELKVLVRQKVFFDLKK